MKYPSYKFTVARLENESAAAPFSRSCGPPPPLRCRALPDESGEWTPPAPLAKPKGTLTSPALVAALAVASANPWIPQAAPARIDSACAPPVTEEREVKLMISFNPRRFKIMKQGPRAGQTVEEKWAQALLVREVSYTAPGGQTLTWKATGKFTKAGFVPPASIKTGSGASRALADVARDFARRWPAQADELVTFLRMAV